VKSVIISEFKARCIGILKEINRSGESLTVTLRGNPLAVIEPARSGHRMLGAQQEETRVCGDIVQTDFDQEWEMSK
jgi:antitoxin (DNA-binding transcriptional repressor) of toxin-antitoxin stability system